jgi:hypothetical protein
MGLLNSKSKIGIEEFCRQFYDSQVFHAVIAGEDVGKGILDTMFDSVAEADHPFATIDRALFYQEMCALRLEVFALAWAHKFNQDKFTIPQSIFTRRYLEENGKLEIWDIMGEYNRAISDSVTLKATGERMEDWRVVQANKTRADMFDKWVDANIVDPPNPTEQEKTFLNCVARVANRIGADLQRNGEISNRRVTAMLLYRLRWEEDKDLSTEALFRLASLVFGMYQGAKEAIKSVNLQV